MTNNDYDRRIEHRSEIVFSNNRYTTPVSFEFAPEKNSQYLNAFASHKKVFIAMKIADTSTKIISNDPQESLHRDENRRCFYENYLK